jgi:GDSL-like Lipase/Acylhydrolase family
VGDSLTYGYGIAEKDTFVHLLNDWLSQEAPVEVFNLGVSGYQSEDIANVIEKFLPQLQPDLVVYTICLNDFLPSGAGEYTYEYAVPLPEKFKTFALAHSRALQFTSDLYDAALRRVHVRRDFFDDILRDFGSYQTRFRHDVARMQAFVSAAGLPPIVGMVLDQSPAYGDRGHMIARVAERAMADAGFDVVSTEDYYRRYNRDWLGVTRWEGHPNEVANYIWAQMLLGRLRPRVPITRAKTND